MSPKDWAETSAYLVAILAAGGSWWQYRRNSARERTRWLFELYQHFYERSSFKVLRIKLDSGEPRAILSSDDALLADFDDFLNFFEFTAYLQRRRELTAGEVRAMFDYILRRLSETPDLLGYIREYGYEELSRLLRDLGYVH